MPTLATDNQHLDFLISQYVDGSLDSAGRKYIETQLTNDPDSRQLFKEHRDVQDLLDDYGSRLPLIDWNAFDAQLAVRLEKTQAQGMANSRWKWIKPAAIAASVMLAAVLGYQWHGSGGAGGALRGGRAVAKSGGGVVAKVKLDRPQHRGASESSARVAETLPTTEMGNSDKPAGLAGQHGVVARGNRHAAGQNAAMHVGIVRLFGPAVQRVPSGASIADAPRGTQALGLTDPFGAHQAGPGSVSAMAHETGLLAGQRGNSWPVH